ncbi:MAG: hemolysin family protein [Bacilli bacterium]|jgi:putative hemolysin
MINAIILNSLLANVPFFIAIIFLLILSAFFSANETAYSSVNIIRIKKYQEDKVKGANKAVYIAEKFDLTLTTILVANNIVNISAATISTIIFSNLIVNPTISNILSTLVMTFIVLIFGEILPKSTTKWNPEKVVLRYSGIMYFFIKFMFPITFFFLKLSKVLSSSKKKPTNPMVTENELESIIDVMETEGVIDEEDADLIQSAISLNTRSVYDIMTPRVDMVAINIKDPIEKIKETFFKYQFSRVPVYENDKDNIVGVLSEREFFTYLLKNKQIKLSELLVSPLFVLETTKVDDLIREMQKQKKHFAIVLDEYGGTSGIVTMEDALEELVGEIYDEYDDEEDGEKITEIEPNKYLISSETSLEEIFEDLKVGKIPDAKYTNVGGFLYEISDEVPYEGKVIKYISSYEEHDIENPVYKEYELIFTISKVDHRRIRTILLEVVELKKDESIE